MKNVEQKIEKLLEEATINWIVNTKENPITDPEGHKKALQELLSKENHTQEDIDKILNTQAFYKLAQMRPYEGKPMPEEDRLLAYDANQILMGTSTPEEKQKHYEAIKSEYNSARK